MNGSQSLEFHPLSVSLFSLSLQSLFSKRRKMSSSRTLRPRKAKNNSMEEDDVEVALADKEMDRSKRKKQNSSTKKRLAQNVEETAEQKPKKTKIELVLDPDCRFLGEPVPLDEALKLWPDRFKLRDKKTPQPKKTKNDDEDEKLVAKCHYLQADVDGFVYNLNDDVFVKGEDGGPDYIGRIVEFFETDDNEGYFTARWFYRANDTVIKDHASLIDKKRVFLSDVRDDNPLNCIVSKLKIAKVAPNVDLVKKTIPECDFYYDMSYSLPYTTFANLPIEGTGVVSDASSTISTEAADSDTPISEIKSEHDESRPSNIRQNDDLTLLDLYSGCGGMSTGLCLGAIASGVNLVTRWAVDINEDACKSLKLNHPETEVRNESADNFFALLIEWGKLCKKFSLLGTRHSSPLPVDVEDEHQSKVPSDSDEFEVGKLIGICYGDPNETKKVGLYFKVRWKGYGPSEDTWEPFSGLKNCEEKIQEFVTSGYKSNILPLPGDADVVCGGPPCQGISGFNRFRNKEAPLDDPKNHQLVVFMDIVDYLKPRYVLMENVVDILKFSGGFLGRYALGRIVSMNYQARLGMMAAGCYGLPQFRMRVFLWGAHPNEKLPQYPLPTHEVVIRGVTPLEFERNTVAYDDNQPLNLEKALLLVDAISDLPPIANSDTNDEMRYTNEAQTDFQRYIRSSKQALVGSVDSSDKNSQTKMLFDHRSLGLNADDYGRVCQIPKKKGANFRDLPGVLVGPDNKVKLDPSKPRVLLPSGKSLVPDYAITFMDGTSSKCFGRLWWDEIVPTVVTRAEPHNQVILHPEQDRVLSIRENARLQGFPDYYKLCGTVKQRYTQIGNAVAVPVARALGYSLGLAFQGICSDQPLFTLPSKFAFSVGCISSESNEDH